MKTAGRVLCLWMVITRLTETIKHIAASGSTSASAYEAKSTGSCPLRDTLRPDGGVCGDAESIYSRLTRKLLGFNDAGRARRSGHQTIAAWAAISEQ